MWRKITKKSFTNWNISGTCPEGGENGGGGIFEKSTQASTQNMNQQGVAIEPSIKVWPSPVDGMLTIDLSNLNVQQIVKQILILDAIGNQVLEFTPTSNQTSVDVSSLPSSLYFLKVLTEDGKVISGKFVKK